MRKSNAIKQLSLQLVLRWTLADLISHVVSQYHYQYTAMRPPATSTSEYPRTRTRKTATTFFICKVLLRRCPCGDYS
eukprot:3224545-Rhodomonas_salina.4